MPIAITTASPAQRTAATAACARIKQTITCALPPPPRATRPTAAAFSARITRNVTTRATARRTIAISPNTPASTRPAFAPRAASCVVAARARPAARTLTAALGWPLQQPQLPSGPFAPRRSARRVSARRSRSPAPSVTAARQAAAQASKPSEPRLARARAAGGSALCFENHTSVMRQLGDGVLDVDQGIVLAERWLLERDGIAVPELR